eukprot:5980335-Pyramimonas_sp.AAC.1
MPTARPVAKRTGSAAGLRPHSPRSFCDRTDAPPIEAGNKQHRHTSSTDRADVSDLRCMLLPGARSAPRAV